jgi:ferredoxin
MAYIVSDACVRCKYSDCVAVCPVDCFYELDEMLVINPDECIDCGACEPECPSTAIFDEWSLPESQLAMVEFNAVMSGALNASDAYNTYSNVPNAENIVEMQDPLPGADEASEETGKIQELAETYGFDPTSSDSYY